jgi:signal transduction histidine kinase/DNA-binding LacI/PurR family transcriptional regulator
MPLAKRTGILSIGYLNSSVSQEWASLPWKGAVEAARANGVNLISFCGNMIERDRDRSVQANAIYELAKDSALDALVVWKGQLTMYLSEAEIAAFFDRYGKPVVTVEGSLPGYPAVTYDNYFAMKDAIAHLIDVHGIERIGYLGLVENHPGFTERFRAYRDILAERGIPYDGSLVCPRNQWDSSSDGGRTNEAVDAWLRDAYASGMRGLVGSCDPNAAWGVERLGRIGINTPRHVSVVGFDGFLLGMTTIPKLSSVHPAWERLGGAAVDTAIKLAKGIPVPKVNFLPSKFIVSRSCGCLDRNVMEAGAGRKGSGAGGNSSDQARALEEVFGEGLDQWVSSSAKTLEDAFWAEASGIEGPGFIKSLGVLLDDALRTEREAMPWQGAVSILRKHLGGSAHDASRRERAECMCDQARVAIGNAAEMQKARALLHVNDRTTIESELFRSLASTFEVEKIIDILSDGLPRLDVRACYLSLYEEPAPYWYPDPAPEWSRLIMAYDSNGVKRFGRKGLRFRTREIVPTELGAPEAARHLLALPLYFEETQIGFINFEADDADLLSGTAFSLLASQISAGLRGTFLIKEVVEKDAMLEATLADLKEKHGELEDAHNRLLENQRMLIISEKMASLGRLTAGIAHEMNTPLAAVRASVGVLKNLVGEYSDSIGDPRVLPEDHRAIALEMRKHADSALISAEKGSGFIRGIKGSTINAATRPAAAFAAAPAIADTLLILDFVFKRAGCALAADLGEGLTLYGDPHELSQIVTNLVNNAVEACPRGAGKVGVSLRAEGEWRAVLRVSDNGTGIAPENLSRIFDPMFTTKPFGEGTGLGLSIVHELVEKFKGRVEVESVPGETVFSVFFPVAKEG